MPVIPQFENQRVYPIAPMSPGVVGQVGETIERSGRQMERLGEYGTSIAFAQNEIDRKAEEANKALKIGIGIKNDTDILAENWNERNDYENFMNDVDEWEKNAREKYQSFSLLQNGNPSTALSKVLETNILTHANELKNVARNKYREGTVAETKGNWEAQKDFYVRDYVNAITSEEKEVVKNNMEMEARVLVDRKIIWPKEAEDEIIKFKSKSEYADARNIIRLNPVRGLEMVEDNKFPNVDPITTGHLIDIANTKIRQIDVEQKRKEVDVEKQRKDNQGTLIMLAQDRVMKGQDWSDIVALGREDGIIDEHFIPNIVTFQKSWNEAVKKADKEENQVVKDKLTVGLYGSKITVSEEDLRRELSAGNINTETFKNMLAHRTSRLESDRREAKTDKQRRQDKAFEHGEKSLGLFFTMQGPGAAIIDREAKTLQSDATKEYYGLVYQDNMDVDKAYDIVRNRYGRALDGIKDREASKLRRSLTVPNSDISTIDDMVLWLESNKSKLPSSTFNSQVRILRDIEGIELSMEQAKKKQEELKKKKKTR